MKPEELPDTETGPQRKRQPVPRQEIGATTAAVARSNSDPTTHMWTSPRRIPTFWDFITEWKAEDRYTAVAYLERYNANWGYRIGWGYHDDLADIYAAAFSDRR